MPVEHGSALPSDEVLHGGLHFLHIFVRQAQEGPGRDFDAHLFLGDPLAVVLEPQHFLPAGPDGAPWLAELMGRCVFGIGADRKAGGVRPRVDGVAELGGLDQGLPALQDCPLGALPPPPVRALALPEAFKRRLPNTLGERGVDTAAVDLGEAPYPAEHSPGVPLQADVVHSSHPPHLSPAEQPGV